MQPIQRYQLCRVSTSVINDYGDILLKRIGNQSGLYILYSDREIYYVGKAKRLDQRLKHHFKDRHQGKWNYFSVYVMDEKTMHDMERLLISLLLPKGNNILYEREIRKCEKDLRREIEQAKKAEVDALFLSQHITKSAPRTKRTVAALPSAPTQLKALQLQFWKAFNTFASAQKPPFTLRSPRPRHWHDLSLGSSQAHIALTISTVPADQMNVSCQLYIPHNKALFNALVQKKAAIEKSIGMKLDWQALDKKKACRIAAYHAIDPIDRGNWKACHTFLLNAAIRFHNGFAAYLNEK